MRLVLARLFGDHDAIQQREDPERLYFRPLDHRAPLVTTPRRKPRSRNSRSTSSAPSENGGLRKDLLPVIGETLELRWLPPCQSRLKRTVHVLSRRIAQLVHCGDCRMSVFPRRRGKVLMEVRDEDLRVANERWTPVREGVIEIEQDRLGHAGLLAFLTAQGAPGLRSAIRFDS